jgi:hypothetical protein
MPKSNLHSHTPTNKDETTSAALESPMSESKKQTKKSDNVKEQYKNTNSARPLFAGLQKCDDN